MEIVGVFLLVLAVALGAPLSPGQSPQEVSSANPQPQIYRQKRSSYPQAYYAPSPCSAAAPIHISPPTYIPSHHSAYAPAIPSIPALPAVSPYGGYGLPALSPYRDAEESEMMSFSDMEPEMMDQFVMEQPMEHTMARYAYGAPVLAPHGISLAPAAAAPIPAIAAAPAQAGPAIGVFPGASTGGCAIPLLLSCSPSIRPGQIVQAHPSYGGNSYRVVDGARAQAFHEAPEPTHEALKLAPSHDAAPEQIQMHQ